MQRYQCHKIVEAAKIVSARERSVVLEGGDVIELIGVPDWTSRFKPDGTDLGYFVRYPGGYVSWSPTKAFEVGYTLIPPPGSDLPADDFKAN